MAKWCSNAIPILNARYLKKDKKGTVIESGDQMLERVAKHISGSEKTDELKAKWFAAFDELLKRGSPRHDRI